jgi:hypothetical protein
MNDASTLPEVRKPGAAPMVAGGDVEAIIPRNLDEAWRLAVTFVEAGMVPSSYEGKTTKETCAKLMIGIMKAMEVGYAPVTGLSNICVINNRPCLWGDGAMGLVQDSGKVEWAKEWFTGEESGDDWTAHCSIKRRGQEEPYEREFSMRDAKRAGLTNKGPWRSYPQRMLKMRARAWALRDGFADVLAGLSIVEEAQDMPAPPEPTKIDFLQDDGDAGTDAPLSTTSSPAAGTPNGDGPDLGRDTAPPAAGEPETVGDILDQLPLGFGLVLPDGTEKMCSDAGAWVAEYERIAKDGLPGGTALKFMRANAHMAGEIARDFEALSDRIIDAQANLRA